MSKIKLKLEEAEEAKKALEDEIRNLKGELKLEIKEAREEVALPLGLVYLKIWADLEQDARTRFIEQIKKNGYATKAQLKEIEPFLEQVPLPCTRIPKQPKSPVKPEQECSQNSSQRNDSETF